MLLTDDQRAALEAYVAGETCAPHYAAVVNDMLRDFKKFGVCEWILAADARLRATAETDRALMKIGAALWCDGIDSALDAVDAAGRALGQTLAERARELAPEGQDG